MKKKKKSWIKIRTLQALNPAPRARLADFKKMPTNRKLSVSARNTWMVLYCRWNPTGLPDAKSVTELSGRSVQAVERDIRQLRERNYIRYAVRGEMCRDAGEEFKMRGEVCCWPVARREWPGVYRRPNLCGED
jgi:hypothetical protein